MRSTRRIKKLHFSGDLDKKGISKKATTIFSPLKRLTSKYRGNLIKVQRNSDDAVKWFGCDFKGNIKSTKILIWLNGSDGLVSEVVNQARPDDNFTQSTKANMPKIKERDFYYKGLRFDGSNDGFTCNSDGLNTTTLELFTIYANVFQDKTGNKRIVTKNIAGNDYSYSLLSRNTDTHYWHIIRTQFGYSGLTPNPKIPTVLYSPVELIMIRDRDNSDTRRIKNLVEYAANAITGQVDYSTSYPLYISGAALGEYFEGYMKYVVILKGAYDNLTLLERETRTNAIAEYALEKLHDDYTGYCIEVRRSSDDATQDIGFVGNSIDQSSLESFCSGTDGYISKRYDQSGNGYDITIAATADQQQIVTGGSMDTLDYDYICYQPDGTSEGLENTLLAINGRIKNLNAQNYLIYPDDKFYTLGDYLTDFVFPLKYDAGLMDFSITNGDNVFWYFEDGTTATADRPAPTLAAGTNYLFATNMTTDNIVMNVNSNKSDVLINLKDMPTKIYQISINDCVNVSGNAEDFPEIEYYALWGGCYGITGDVKYLPDPSYFNWSYNIANLTGDFADVRPSQRMRFNGFTNVSGVLTPEPTTTEIYTYDTAQTSDDTDNSLIAAANIITAINGTYYHKTNRTSASDAAVATLEAKGWTVLGYFNGVLDSGTHLADSVVSYSLYQLTRTYTGYCMKIRRSSDDATKDIMFLDTYVDIATIESFCAGTDGYVDTWYDQSGNGNDLTQSTSDYQPKICENGTFISDGISFDGVNDRLENVSTADTIRGGYVNFIVNDDITASVGQVTWNIETAFGGGIKFGDTTGYATNEIINIGNYSPTVERSSWTDASGVITKDTTHKLFITFDSGTPQWNIKYDGDDKPITTYGTPVALTSDNLVIGGRADHSGQWLNGYCKTFMLFDANDMTYSTLATV